MKPRRKQEWFDDDSLWREIYPFLFPERRIAATPEQVRKVLKLTKPRGKKVLDLCCGPGRCSIVLAKKGFKVTGVDRTRFFLDVARERAETTKVKVEWIQQDMRDFVRPKAFDLVLNLWTSFGYFDDPNEDLRVLRNIHKSLRPGGVCLIDVIGRECVAKFQQSNFAERLPDGTVMFQHHHVAENWTKMHQEWTILRVNGRTKTLRFSLTLYSGGELRARLEQAGFKNIKLYGSLDGDDYGPYAQRLIIVGQKN